MAAHSPYTLNNVFLNEKITNISALSINETGYYLVFWWHSIPLGDLYICREEEIDNEEFKNMVIKAVTPSINYYAEKAAFTSSYKEAYLSDNFPLFSKILDKIFAAFIAEQLPGEVEISVVICTRNRSKRLQLCLESLQKQICTPKEIIVVDNAPTDNNTRLVVENFPNATYLLEARPGLDIARNAGAKKASYPIVAYTDDDVFLHPMWTYRVWESFISEDTDAITGLVIASSLDTESQQIFEKHWSFNKGYVDKVFDQDFLKSKSPKVWDIGAGANMAFRKEVLNKINYFDERLDVGAAGCSGDSEIWYRILLAGFKIKYNPRAVVYHEHRREISALHKQIFNYMRGHAASVLIQHSQNKKAGYRRYLFYEIPKYYLLLFRIGFPSYSFRYRTLISEVKGLVSGVRFFYRNRKNPLS
ncbi:glycosyltransferase family 2 protein [Segetibacter koreensis]|uniref:glycosyltransferase family 2 protein n=1 Tax=Segetibacter koreensis TaxID=398037 RepID=UPI000379C98B|nr:glycosyltransferase [Segetibacter koreensis]